MRRTSAMSGASPNRSRTVSRRAATSASAPGSTRSARARGRELTTSWSVAAEQQADPVVGRRAGRHGAGSHRVA